jgi:hypothetical protein
VKRLSMLLLVLAALCGCSAFRTPYYKIVTPT